MIRTSLSICLLAAVIPAFPALAQDQGDQTLYAYATYFICSPDGESRADEIINSSFKPHYDAAVKHGDISSWSWMQHYIGGKWRRVLVITAADMDAILDASGALGEIVQDQTPEAGRAFSGICSSHEDYIWETVGDVSTGTAAGARGDADFTAYFRCDASNEDRADELVREVFGPVYARYVENGKLATWNWLKHHVGGDFRRILTMTAADHKALMKARAEILAEFDDRRTERALKEFNQICHSHHDYLWDIIHETP